MLMEKVEEKIFSSVEENMKSSERLAWLLVKFLTSNKTRRERESRPDCKGQV